MCRNTQALAALVFLVVSVVDGHRSSTNHSPQSRYGINPWEQRYWRLNSQMKSCVHGYVCDVKSGPRGCEPVCINRQQLCDGHGDCENAEDEAGCMEIKECKESEFVCMVNKVTKCLPMSEWCNGSPVCDNNSDEQECPCLEVVECKESEFTCMINNVKKCLPMSEWCNGSPVCDNNSDEQDCPTKCSPKQVRCSLNDKICANFCDGVPECPTDNGFGYAYVEDEPVTNCKCQINFTAPKCVEKSKINFSEGMIDSFPSTEETNELYVLQQCQIQPLCTGFLNRPDDGNIYLASIDLNALEEINCEDFPSLWALAYPCISEP